MTTLAQLKTSILDLADHTGSERVTTARLVEYINAQVREVAALVYGAGENRPEKHVDITLVAATEAYDLPTDFQLLTRLWLKDGTDRYELWPTNTRAFDYAQNWLTVDNKSLRYSIREDTTGDRMQLFFRPIPASGDTVEVWYKPKVAALASDSDTLPLSWPEEARDYITYGAIVLVRARDEEDTQEWRALKAGAKALLEQTLRDVDRGHPRHIIDVY